MSYYNFDFDTEWTIIGGSWCGFCKKARTILDNNPIVKEYKWIKVQKDNNREIIKDNLASLTNNHRTFPMIFHNKKFIGGSTELIDYLENNNTIFKYIKNNVKINRYYWHTNNTIFDIELKINDEFIAMISFSNNSNKGKYWEQNSEFIKKYKPKGDLFLTNENKYIEQNKIYQSIINIFVEYAEENVEKLKNM